MTRSPAWEQLERELGEGWEDVALACEVDAAIEETIRESGLYQALSRSFRAGARRRMRQRDAIFADVIADALDALLPGGENELGREVLAPMFIVDAWDELAFRGGMLNEQDDEGDPQ